MKRLKEYKWCGDDDSSKLPLLVFSLSFAETLSG